MREINCLYLYIILQVGRLKILENNRSFLRSSAIRVLVNGIHAKSGGGITYISNVLPLLADDEGLELHLFLHKDQFELFGIVDERIRIHLLDFPNGFFMNLCWEQFVLPILAKSMSVDVTLSPANYGPIFAPRNIILLRNSLAVVGRETRPVKRLYWLGLALMTGLSLLTCKHAIAVSTYAKRALTFQIKPFLEEKVSIVYHGVRSEFRPNFRIKRDKFLLAVSDIYVQKNLHTLISALALVRDNVPDCKLKVAGKAIDQGYLAEIKRVIEVNKLENCVEFVGEKTVDELVELYQTCNLFVFPSTVETFGNPLVEAMACGAPIVSSNTAAMPEILESAAKYFDPLDIVDIANSIVGLLADDKKRNDLTTKSIERSQAFSWSDSALRTAAIIKRVAPKLTRNLKMRTEC